MLYLEFYDQHGERIRRSTGLRVGQEDKAEKVLRQVVAKLNPYPSHTRSRRGPLVKDFKDDWISTRQHLKTVKDDEQRLRKHVMPHIGSMPLEAVTRQHICEIQSSLRETSLAPRTQRHVYHALKAMFAEAVTRKLIDTNPCELQRHELPKIRDKNLARRELAQFSYTEAERLMTDENVPEYRRIAYTILFMSGVRAGELIALRWKDILPDEEARKLFIHQTYCTKTKTLSDSTKTDVARVVPIHPTLDKILLDWRTMGWARTYGREPLDDDLIIPNPYRPGRGRRIGGPKVFLRGDTLRKQMKGDCSMLGFRSDRTLHDTRATFITLARQDGILGRTLELWTHKKRNDVQSIYYRPTWPQQCEEMNKFTLLRGGRDKQVSQKVRHTFGTPLQPMRNKGKKDGAGGNRTRVRKYIPRRRYVRSITN